MYNNYIKSFESNIYELTEKQKDQKKKKDLVEMDERLRSERFSFYPPFLNYLMSFYMSAAASGLNPL